ncbi:hypothetical protein [Nocardia asteroides]|uniref:hypothetical protein n=1 Tax=Nocardia asteroides TaxID=1824 RepID=UPI0033E80099
MKPILELLSESETPEGFIYPSGFKAIVDRGLTNLEPWQILGGERLRRRLEGMRNRYPARRYIPFAARGDCDDVACWVHPDNRRVLIVHDFASPGHEERAEFVDIYGWLHQAIEDLIEFDELS